MLHFARIALFALLIVLPAYSEQPMPAARPGELARIRVLIVADTHSNLAESVSHDRSRMSRLFAGNVPEDRLLVTVLDGKRVVRDNILGHFRKMKGLRNEAVVFYFAGHGAIDAKHGHFMWMQPPDGPALLRSDLRRAMEGTGAGLVVVLTDCCSNAATYPPTPGSPPRRATKGRTPLHPTMRDLFFLSRGVVDITGTQKGAASWGDDWEGGVFTRAVCDVLARSPRELDANRDGKVTWTEAFQHIRAGTSLEFRRWKSSIPREARGRVKQDSQVPHAFLIRTGETPPRIGSAPKSMKK